MLDLSEPYVYLLLAALFDYVYSCSSKTAITTLSLYTLSDVKPAVCDTFYISMANDSARCEIRVVFFSLFYPLVIKNDIMYL